MCRVSNLRRGGSSSSIPMRTPTRHPRWLRELVEAVNDRLRLYPDPMATEFRRAAAELNGVEPDMVLAGNGSDDLLTILIRAFVGPGDLAGYPSPSYLLYSTLIALQGGRARRSFPTRPTGHSIKRHWPFPVSSSSSWPILTVRRGRRSCASNAALAGSLDCPLIVDEAYADFADPRYHAMPLLRDHPNVIVTRSFSKGYSLAGIRLGYLVAREARSWPN